MQITDAYSNRSGRPETASCLPLGEQRSFAQRAKRLSRSGLARVATAAAVFCSVAHGQAKPTAVRTSDFQAGVGFSLAAPDYTEMTFKGISGYAVFDFKPNYGIEFDIHQVNAPSPSDLYERTYELGGRYVRHYGLFHPYAKVMYGRGVFNYEYKVANLAYNLGTIGAGVDVNVQRHVNVRADYEYQHWFNFHGFVQNGFVTSASGSLTPQVFTIGAAYHF